MYILNIRTRQEEKSMKKNLTFNKNHLVYYFLKQEIKPFAMNTLIIAVTNILYAYSNLFLFLKQLQYICNKCLSKTIKTRCAKFLKGYPPSKLCISMTLTHSHFVTEILYCLEALALKIDVQYIFRQFPSSGPTDPPTPPPPA